MTSSQFLISSSKNAQLLLSTVLRCSLWGVVRIQWSHKKPRHSQCGKEKGALSPSPSLLLGLYEMDSLVHHPHTVIMSIAIPVQKQQGCPMTGWNCEPKQLFPLYKVKVWGALSRWWTPVNTHQISRHWKHCLNVFLPLALVSCGSKLIKFSGLKTEVNVLPYSS